MPGVVPFGTLPGFGTYPLPQGYMPTYNPMLAAHMAQWYQSYHGRFVLEVDCCSLSPSGKYLQFSVNLVNSGPVNGT